MSKQPADTVHLGSAALARPWPAHLNHALATLLRRALVLVDAWSVRLLLPVWAAPMSLALLAMLLLQTVDHPYIRGSLGWSLVVTGTLATLFIALYWALTRRSAVLVPARSRPLVALLIVFLVGNTIVHAFLLVPHLLDANRYSTDAGAATDCATQMVLQGRNPYTNLHTLTCLDAHHLAFNQTTPLSRGAFKQYVTFATPVTAHISYLMWHMYYVDLANERKDSHYPYRYAAQEFEERFNYPAGSILFGIAAWLVGTRDLVALFLGCALGISLWIYRQAHARLRAVTALLLLADLPLVIDSANGSTDILYAVSLVLYWRFRERALLGGLLLGLGAATRQQVWFFIPFLLYLAWRTAGSRDPKAPATIPDGRGASAAALAAGWRDLKVRASATALVFLVCNLPFIVLSPLDWLAGVLGPMTDPMFAQGVGVITLSIAFFAKHPGIPLMYTALEAAAYVVAFRFYTRRCLSAPGLAMLLPLMPIALAWRSLHTYFVILPLLALAVLTCPPNGSDAEVVTLTPS
jgi:hypothetical protein